MLGLLSGYWYSQCLYVMAALGIADCLAAGPKTAEALSIETQCRADSLYRFLRAMASAGILREVEPRRFALTPLSEMLRSDREDSLRSMALLGGHPLHWQAWGNLLHSVRTGETAWDVAHPQSFFEPPVEDRALSTAFHDVQSRLHVLDPSIVDALDLGGFERIVDLGGGSGGLARRIASSYPDARVILFDREEVLELAPADPRVELVAGDFFETIPTAEAYVLKFVLHDWNDARATRILRNCRDALADGGRVFVVEGVVPDDTSRSMAKMHDLNMLALTGGRERTLDEYRSLCSAARLELVRVVPTQSGVSVLEARSIATHP
jgi:precorrin-6B methylase 2